ncbi:hypothetical protein [Neolewinella sp.]|uniref:hypothetical protein n=1 Tax=Neolewinella sp. TaxID=2993543 RepID=UPI003B5208FF
MNHAFAVRFSVLLLLLLLLASCGFEADNWTTKIPLVGSSSSPVATDLNEDGYLDIIIGGAAQEFEHVAASILALNGRTGQTLWQVSGHNQVVGTAILQDIMGDGTDDVFIRGRSATFKAIDGSDDTVLVDFPIVPPG